MDSPGDSPMGGVSTVPFISPSHKTKSKGGGTGSKGISLSVKKVFRRKSSNGRSPSSSSNEKKEKRNSAPNMGEGMRIKCISCIHCIV